MFCIRDVSIRLVLLLHFNSFIHTFQTDELKCQVLPELLVGIKDTNDHLVCATLKALADIVPILGSATVIGGKRGKLFTDGRPNKLKENEKAESSGNVARLSTAISAIEKSIDLPERPSPDGGEDKKEIVSSVVEEEYVWSDWDIQETGDVHLRISQPSDMKTQCNRVPTLDPAFNIITDPTLNGEKIKQTESMLGKKLTVLSDISELDIKSTKVSDAPKEEYNFFTDMEPVIKKTQIVHVQQPHALPKSVFDINLLNGLETTEENDGWDEDLSDWDTEHVQEEKT